MIITWLIINARGLDQAITSALIKTAEQLGYNPHYYATTPWFMHIEGWWSSEDPSIQIYCASQNEAFRLRKALRATAFTNSTDKERRNPLQGHLLFQYTDEDGNEAERQPIRRTG